MWGARTAQRDPRLSWFHGPGPQTPRTADRQFPKPLTLWPAPLGPQGLPEPSEQVFWGWLRIQVTRCGDSAQNSPRADLVALSVQRTRGSRRGGGLWGQWGQWVWYRARVPTPCALPTVSRSPPSNLTVASESPNSLRVSWTPPSGHVLHYRLTYTLASGSGPEKSVGLGGTRKLSPLWAPGSWGRWGQHSPLCLLRVADLPR